MNKNHSFVGSNVALITPMLDDGSVDYESLNNLIEFHIDAGTSSIVSVGTTGESATVGVKEHLKILDHTIKYAARRIPIIAGTGANSTSEAIELTQEAKNFGADACLLVTPYYNKPTQEGLFQHFKLIAESVSIDQILYNVPGRTAVDMSVDTTSRLSEISNIIGIKDATGDIPRGKQLIDQLAGKIAVYSGDDATAYQLILAGAKGNISVTANVMPKQVSELCRLAAEGLSSEAGILNDQLMSLHDSMFVESNPIPVKYALMKMGMIGQGIRLPLTELNSQYHAQLDQELSARSLI